MLRVELSSLCHVFNSVRLCFTTVKHMHVSFDLLDNDVDTYVHISFSQNSLHLFKSHSSNSLAWVSIISLPPIDTINLREALVARPERERVCETERKKKVCKSKQPNYQRKKIGRICARNWEEKKGEKKNPIYFFRLLIISWVWRVSFNSWKNRIVRRPIEFSGFSITKRVHLFFHYYFHFPFDLSLIWELCSCERCTITFVRVKSETKETIWTVLLLHSFLFVLRRILLWGEFIAINSYYETFFFSFEQINSLKFSLFNFFVSKRIFVICFCAFHSISILNGKR